LANRADRSIYYLKYMNSYINIYLNLYISLLEVGSRLPLDVLTYIGLKVVFLETANLGGF